VHGGEIRYANLDYAASAPALRCVVDRIAELLPLYSSVHRGAGYASAVCTSAYEAARRDIGAFVGAREGDVVVFTRHTTDALNLLATAVPGPVVYLDIEHHANLLPWQTRGGRVVIAGSTLGETLGAVRAELAREPAALLAVTGASNVTGECLPVTELAAIAHAHGARIAVDGAQLMPHRRIGMAASDIDYLAFSGHKMYAPFGAGVLAGRGDWLDAAAPYLAGGGAVREVRLDGTGWAAAPARHEAGTPNVVGAVALATACRYMADLPAGAMAAHEGALLELLTAGLESVDGVRILRLWPGEAERIAVVSFVVEGWPSALVAQYLSAEHGIGVRDGRFCAHPFLARLNPVHRNPVHRGPVHRSGADPSGSAVRASLGLGSSAADVDRLVGALAALRSRGPAWTYGGAEDGYRPSPDSRPLPDWTSGAPGAASPCRLPNAARLPARGAFPGVPGLVLILQALVVFAFVEQPEAEGVLSGKVAVHADLAGRRAGVHRVLMTAESRLNGLHPLDEAPGVLPVHRRRRLRRVAGALRGLPRLVERYVTCRSGRSEFRVAHPASRLPVGPCDGLRQDVVRGRRR
jgi:selenocysteine lyase/cysteine desulfurase